ncbi:MAG TPA: TonB C-terminal domain-containing protein [Nitrospirae bacterium]|nr:TonB C-terminal domain-containing protein [Nitrospirota bacterium]
MQSLGLKLNNYIAVSILLHILLLGVFVNLRPEVNYRSFPVFDVDIVGPIEEARVPEAIRLPASPPPAVIERPEQSDIAPKTMFDGGAGPGPSRSGDQEMALVPGEDSEKALDSEEPPAYGKSVLPEAEQGLALEPGSYLFDKGTIEKYARMGTTKDKGLTFDVPEFHYRGYMRRLKGKIENIWKFPKGVGRVGNIVDLYIKFSINRDGSLGEVVLMRTSGYWEFDKAALQALRDAGPYWPLPEDWREDDLTIDGHFIYILGRSYIM